MFCTTALFTWKLDATDVTRMAGLANYRITLDMYVGTTARHPRPRPPSNPISPHPAAKRSRARVQICGLPGSSSPISVLAGDNDPKTTLDEAKAWAAHTSGPFDLRAFSGGHFFLTGHADEIIGILDEHFRALADELSLP